MSGKDGGGEWRGGGEGRGVLISLAKTQYSVVLPVLGALFLRYPGPFCSRDSTHFFLVCKTSTVVLIVGLFAINNKRIL